jgi:TolA-binding protein
VERFLVDLPDGELEVRGTTFLVTASAGTTEQVSVEEGVVLLRLRYLASEVVLEKGETWNARPKKAPGPASPMPAWHPAGSGSAPTPSTTPSASLAEDEGVESYAAAVGLWQGHHYTAAATALHAFVLAHPSAPQLEDASFLEAASLAQVGRPDAAALVAEDHLARFPASFHRRDAALLVARAARDRGECAQVKSVLAPWIDSDTEASQIARECAAADAGSK